MPREILARTVLSRVRGPDEWFGLGYSMNLYRGCQHGCIYCDSRSECYRIDDFTDIQVKVNAVEVLRRELATRRRRAVIGTGSMHDPYMPLEAEVGLTRRALEAIADHGFPVHIITKSDLVLRDADVIGRIGRVYAAVSLTVTTADDALARKLEPHAPPPSARFAAIRRLAGAGILTGVVMMPLLPFIEDTEENVAAIVDRAAAAGAGYIIPAFGVTLRDRQRDWYYAQLERLFPGLREKYEARYGDRYSCAVPGAARLERAFRARCAEAGLEARIPPFDADAGGQQRIF
jgi:DNA repair photolyase